MLWGKVRIMSGALDIARSSQGKCGFVPPAIAVTGGLLVEFVCLVIDFVEAAETLA